MPRQARLDAPGKLHHVIVRGIEKRRIKDFPWQRQVVSWGSQLLLFPRFSSGERVSQYSQLRPLIYTEDFPGPDKCPCEKMLDSRITDSERCGAPAKFCLTTKPVLT